MGTVSPASSRLAVTLTGTIVIDVASVGILVCVSAPVTSPVDSSFFFLFFRRHSEAHRDGAVSPLLPGVITPGAVKSNARHNWRSSAVTLVLC